MLFKDLNLDSDYDFEVFEVFSLLEYEVEMEEIGC